ncbi:MAG: hypothetical protein NTZ80_00435 [Patescibacteria group bacterium]|nr:hypothetical protein [Patescibacteria group bacterium]
MSINQKGDKTPVEETGKEVDEKIIAALAPHLASPFKTKDKIRWINGNLSISVVLTPDFDKFVEKHIPILEWHMKSAIPADKAKMLHEATLEDLLNYVKTNKK